MTASDGAAGDYLGVSVAVAGETIVAGASGDDVGANQNQGSAYTFARTGAVARTETAKLSASDGAAFDQLGVSVAVAGETIVAGASGDDVGANENQGSAYTFARTGAAARTETAKLSASDGAAGDYLGYSVAVAGETIVAGAYGDDVGANQNQGSAYTFARTGAVARTETAKLSASDGAAGDYLGVSVAVAGETIVAGAYGDDVGANADQGSASIFFAPAPIAPTPIAPTPIAPAGPGPTPGPALTPGACANTKRGTSAADRLLGTSAGDRLLGLGGGDRLSGLAQADCLTGGRGADRLTGGAGNDRLAGGPGNDRLSGGSGRNRYSAGAGNDTIRARNNTRERIDCGPGRDRANVDRSDRLRRCERIRRR